MALQLQGNPSQHGFAGELTSMFIAEQPQCSSRKWYLSRVDIEEHSPSRKDGIDLNMEAHLRKLYCSFLKDLGRTLKVPQMTIATAMMFCHRFYLRQSHAKNDWQSIATVSMFLACKVEETPCLLRNVVVVAYELTYRWDPSAPRRIKQKEIYEKQKDLITVGERLLLATLAFDFNIEHPYKPLVSALKKLDISHKDIAKVAWNFVNDWLCTTLCLQYKPHYIAAASLFLAAKFNKVKLPMENGKLWWHEFDISPKQLEEVIQHMLRLLEQTRKQTQPCKRVTESTTEVGKVDPNVTQLAKATSSVAAQSSLTEAPMESGSGLSNCTTTTSACRDNKMSEEVIKSQESDAGSARSAVEDGDFRIPSKVPDFDSSQTTGVTTVVPVDGKYSKIDVNSIREKLKKRKLEKAASVKQAHPINDESDLWIEKELENGIDLGYTSTEKKQRTAL